MRPSGVDPVWWTVCHLGRLGDRAMAQGICVVVNAAEREQLVAIAADRNRPRKHIERARIVLASADRGSARRVAQSTSVSRPTVWRWQQRFAKSGVEFDILLVPQLGTRPIETRVRSTSDYRMCAASYPALSGSYCAKQNKDPDQNGRYSRDAVAGRSQTGCQSRTQRPQFQPRRLLQCQPGPHPSAIRSTRCAKPIPNKVGLADIGRACACTMAKVTEITIIGASTRITTTIPNAECRLTDGQLTQSKGIPPSAQLGITG